MDGMELDRLSKHVLVKLGQLEEATAGELRDALGLEQNQQIHYRMDNKLIPGGYVYEQPQRREQPGSRKSARVYEIEPRGEEWVENHGHKVTLSDLDAAEQEIQRLTSEVQDISQDVQKLREWRQEQAGKTGGISTRVSDLSDRLESVEGQVRKHNERDYSAVWDQLHSLNTRTETLEERVPRDSIATEPQLRTVESDVRDLEDQINRIESRLEDIETTQNEWTQYATKIEERMRELEQRTLIDYILPWR